MKIIRFNQAQPGFEPVEMSARYRASIDMAEYAEALGFDLVSLEEHHGTDNGWSPSPLITAGLLFGRCSRISASISALLLPLHDPLRVAEDFAVLDLASEGRLRVVAGIGYRPEEYAAHGKSWADRGRLMDEGLEVLLTAWTGKPFEYRGTTVQVTPRPVSQPHPPLFVGGTSKPAARRAARFGLPLLLAAPLPEIGAYYDEQRAVYGTKGYCIVPQPGLMMLFVHDDPDQAWDQLGHHLLHEARTYAGWQTPDVHSGMHSRATTVAELRAEGIYRIVSPDDCLAQAEVEGPDVTFVLHPLVGGMPVEEGWRCLRLFGEKVVPYLPSPAGQ